MLAPVPHEVDDEHEEGAEDAPHLGGVLQGGHPYFVEEAVAGHYLYKSPEHDDRGDAHADVGAPGADVQLPLQHEEGAGQAEDGHGVGHGVVVAQEHGVVAEHEHQVEGPHHGVELHEGDDAHVARHGLGHDDVAAPAEELLLAPVDGVAAGAQTADVDEGEHHEETERRRHGEILGTRAAQQLELGAREVFEWGAVDEKLMAHADAVDVVGDGGDGAGAHQVAVGAVALGVVGKQKLHPAGPEEQAAGQSVNGLAGVALHKDAHHGDDQSHEAHEEGGVVEQGGLHEVLHEHHEGVAQGHGEEHEEKRTEGLADVDFSFHGVGEGV